MSKDLYVGTCVGVASYTVDSTTFTNIFPTTYNAKYIIFHSNADVYIKFSTSSTSNTEKILANTQNTIYDMESAGFYAKATSGTAIINVVYYS